MNYTIGLSSLALAFTSLSSSAIEIPAPEAPKAKTLPLENGNQKLGELKLAENEMKIAYLGVSGNSLSDVLKAQLNLEDGLALEFVQPGSPASQSGLAKHDIIVKLGESKIGSQLDLRDAMSRQKPNDKVQATVIRKGKEQKLTLTLGTRMKPKLARNGLNPRLQMVPGFGMNAAELERMGIPKAQAGRILDLLKGQQNLPKPKALFKFGKQGNGFNMERQTLMNDQEGSVLLKTNKKGKIVTVKDKSGNVIFEGPMNNENDKLAIPEDILKRIENLGIDKKEQELLPFGGR